MYKRRDWLHLHGEDGGASDSSDNSDSDSQHEDDGMAEASGSSDSEADEMEAPRLASAAAVEPGSDSSRESEEGSPGGYESEVSEPVGRRRIEDLSEEDFDSDKDDEELEDVKRSWLEVEHADPEHKPAGRALKCRVCNGKLLLSALALQQHIASKRHLRNIKGSGEEPTEPICFADQLANDENVETHQERMQRLQQSGQQRDPSATAAALSKSSGAAKRRRRQQHLAAGGVARGKGQKKKPGKRQRASLKEAGKPAAAAGDASGKQRKAKRQKIGAT